MNIIEADGNSAGGVRLRGSMHTLDGRSNESTEDLHQLVTSLQARVDEQNVRSEQQSNVISELVRQNDQQLTLILQMQRQTAQQQQHLNMSMQQLAEQMAQRMARQMAMQMAQEVQELRNRIARELGEAFIVGAAFEAVEPQTPIPAAGPGRVAMTPWQTPTPGLSQPMALNAEMPPMGVDDPMQHDAADQFNYMPPRSQAEDSTYSSYGSQSGKNRDM